MGALAAVLAAGWQKRTTPRAAYDAHSPTSEDAGDTASRDMAWQEACERIAQEGWSSTDEDDVGYLATDYLWAVEKDSTGTLSGEGMMVLVRAASGDLRLLRRLLDGALSGRYDCSRDGGLVALLLSAGLGGDAAARAIKPPGSEQVPMPPATDRPEPRRSGDNYRPSRLIRTPEDAEEAAAEFMRDLGYLDATVTAPGSDGGLDVVSSEAVAQVKMEGVKTARPVVQALYGAATAEAKLGLFFSLAGYTSEAIAWADRVAMPLLQFDYQGDPEPVNEPARLWVQQAQDHLSAPTSQEPSHAPTSGLNSTPRRSVWARITAEPAGTWTPTYGVARPEEVGHHPVGEDGDEAPPTPEAEWTGTRTAAVVAETDTVEADLRRLAVEETAEAERAQRGSLRAALASDPAASVAWEALRAGLKWRSTGTWTLLRDADLSYNGSAMRLRFPSPEQERAFLDGNHMEILGEALLSVLGMEMGHPEQAGGNGGHLPATPATAVRGDEHRNRDAEGAP